MEKNIKIGDILKGAFWQEPIRVLSVKQIGKKLKIEAVGIKTKTYFNPILSEGDIEKIERIPISETIRNFRGNAEEFFLGIESWRIRYAYQFDPLYAINVSQIDPLPHQIEAVYHYILKNPKIRFLLADDAGAGKTIMAGLVLKELKYRGIIEKTLIITPGHLKEQWQIELKEKFNEVFDIVDRGTIDKSWSRNIWQEEKQLIASMDFAKQEDVKSKISETKFDLVIVDEAHKMSAFKFGEKTDKTERYRLGEILSESATFLLFLTATPHRGDPENFRLLLDLLEPGFFATKEMVAESIKNKDNPLFIRRLKEDMKDFENKPLFLRRNIKTIKYRLSEDEAKLYNGVTEYVGKEFNKALTKEKRNVIFALLVLQRRLASSVRAIRNSLERRKKKLEDLYEKGEIIQEKGIIDEEVLENYTEEERWEKEEELEKLTASENMSELKNEIEKLDELVKLAKGVEKKEIETKLTELKKVIEAEELKKNKDNKLLIFTESKDTLDYLVEKIKSWGYSTTFIHGRMKIDKRIEAKNEFMHTAQIMVATEAAGEGINLQFCWMMVNYDIPWNPNRLEQRMGRIHRYGQRYEVHIYNLVSIDTREGRILDRLFEKLERMREAMGNDKVFDVIGDIYSGKKLQDLIVDAITNKRSIDDILKDIESIPDEEAIEKVKEATMEGLATKHLDLSKVLGEMRKAKENRLVPEYIEKFFLKSADRVNLKIIKKNGLYSIPSIPFEIRNTTHDFKLRYGEVFREYSKVSFDKEFARKNQAEFIAPGHPLLESVIGKIIENYGSELEKGAVFIDSSNKLNGFIFFIEGEIKNGNNVCVGKRIFALYQDKDGIRQVSPSILWDLKPSNKENLDLNLNEDEIISFASENILNGYLEELRKQREHEADLKRKYGIKSIDSLIMDSEAKLVDYETRKAKNETVLEVNVQNEQKKKEDLENKKNRLLKEIDIEINLWTSSPKIIGIAVVMPYGIKDNVLVEDKEVELIGMKVAMDYELKQGRIPEDVSSLNLGYDIRSKDKDKIRYIEVKARAKEGKIGLTPNEWLMTSRLKEEYYLYVVVNCASVPELYGIQNPSEVLEPNEEVEIVRYVIDDWKNKARRLE